MNQKQTSTPKTHELKQHPIFFDDVKAGKLNAQVRRADRPYKVGDLLFIKEYSGLLGLMDGETGGFTGRTVTVKILGIYPCPALPSYYLIRTELKK